MAIANHRSGDPGYEGQTGLEVQDSVCRGHHTIVLRGELDMSNAEALETIIQRLCIDGISGIVLDLSQLDFMDSSGLRAVLSSQATCKQHGYDLSVIPGCGAVRRLLELTGTLGVLRIEENLAT